MKKTRLDSPSSARRGYLTPPVIIILALITLFVAASLYFHTFLLKGIKSEPITSPTSSPNAVSEPNDFVQTANWKTYQNSDHDYEIKYPESLIPYEKSAFSTLFYPGDRNMTSGFPTFPTYYISMIPDGSWENSAIYNNVSPAFISDLKSLKIGEKMKSGGMYDSFDRLPDIFVDHQDAMVYENENVREYQGKDRLVLIKDFIDTTFMVGTYYKTEDELKNFNEFLSTFKSIEIATVKQGEWILKIVQEGNSAYIYLTNGKTGEGQIIGETHVILPGNRAVFSHDSSIVIFSNSPSYRQNHVGEEVLEQEGIAFYSISDKKISKLITLEEIKKALPSLNIPRNGSLNSLNLSPDGNKLALSYGYTYELDDTSDIIIVDLVAYKISTANAKGVVVGWKNSRVIQYKTHDYEPDYHIAVKEVSVH